MNNLRACRDCGHEVSPHAESCPNCGAPINPKRRHGVFYYVFWGVISLFVTVLICAVVIPVVLSFGIIGAGSFLKARQDAQEAAAIAATNQAKTDWATNVVITAPAAPTLDVAYTPSSPSDLDQLKAAAANDEANARVLKYHQDLADKGDPYGLLKMGERYAAGDGVEQNDSKARLFLARSAAAGNSEAASDLAKFTNSVVKPP